MRSTSVSESSKFGYAPEKALAELKEINALPKLELHGLMTVAPYAREAEKVRPVFRELRELKGGMRRNSLERPSPN